MKRFLQFKTLQAWLLPLLLFAAIPQHAQAQCRPQFTTGTYPTSNSTLNLAAATNACTRSYAFQMRTTGTSGVTYKIRLYGATGHLTTIGPFLPSRLTYFNHTYNVGTTFVRVEATNNCGTTLHEFKIVVKETTPPIITGGPSSLNIATTNGCKVNSFSILNYWTATDNCNGVLKSLSPSSISIGTNNYTLIATDASGNTDTKNVQITLRVPEIDVRDNNGNISIAHNDLTPSSADQTDFGTIRPDNVSKRYYRVYNTASVASLKVTDVNVTNATNGGGFSIVNNPFPANIPPGGYKTFAVRYYNYQYSTTPRTADIVINNGDCNESNYKFRVSATSGCPPVNMSGNFGTININADPGKCHANYTFSMYGSSQVPVTDYKYVLVGATNATVQSNSKVFNYDYNVGTTTVFVSATNNCGRVFSNYYRVVVTDNQPPKIHLSNPFNYYMTSGCGLPSKLIGYGVTDNCGVDTIYNNAPDTLAIGTTNILWTAKDIHGNINTRNQVVTVSAGEINVKYGNVGIANNDGTPSTTDGTDFGTVNYGSKVDRTFTIHNTGTAPLLIKDVNISGGNGKFTILSAPNANSTIGINSSANVVVRCNSTVYGYYKPILNIESGACDESIYNFKLRGYTESPYIRVRYGGGTKFVNDGSPASVYYGTDFGNVTYGNTKTTTLRISNSSSTPLKISSINITGGNADRFSHSMSYPVTIPSGIVVNLPITYSADTIGTHNATVSIINDDQNYGRGNYTFRLKGTTICDTPVFSSTPANTIVNTDNGKCNAVVNYTANSSTATSYTYTLIGATTGSGSGTGSGSTFIKGTTQVNITAVNSCGASASHSFTVTVNDNEAPAITAPANVTVNADNGKNYASNVSLGNPVTSDNCLVKTASNNAPSTFPVGNTNVVWTVEDMDGNTSTATQTVQVKAPKIAVRGSTFGNINNGDMSPSSGNENTLWYTSTCDTITKTHRVINFGNAPLVVDTIYLTGQHASSFSIASISFPFTINGNGTLSSYRSFRIRTQATTFGNKNAIVNIVNNDTLYKYAIRSVVSGPEINITGLGRTINTGDTTPRIADNTNFGNVNLYSIVYKRFDVRNMGNAALSISNIRITGPDKANFNISGSVPGVSAQSSRGFDVRFNSSRLGVHNATVEIFSNDCDEPVYTYAVTANVTCAPANITSCPSNIMLNTAAAQCGNTATYNTTITGTPNPSVSYTFSGATTGNGAGNGSGTTFNTGVTNVQVVATNSCGTDTCNFTITVNDNELPALTIPADKIFVLDGSSCTIPADSIGVATANDNCGIASLTNNAPVSGFAKGTHTVLWTATDVNGNTTIDSQIVQVKAPEIVATANINLGNVTFNTQNSFLGQIANTGDAPLHITGATLSGPDSANFTYGNILNNLTVQPGLTQFFGMSFTANQLGVNQATLTIYNDDCDENPHIITLKATVICDDASFVSCPSNISTNAEIGQCSKAVSYTASAVGGPAPAYSYTFSGATTGSGSGTGSGSSFSVGITNVQVIAANGCSADTCSFTITVTDNQAPVITAPSPVVVNADNGSCVATGLSLGTPATSDNCGVDTVWNNAPASFPVGMTIVKWMVNDIHGNVDSAYQVVTVNDNQAPVIVCASNITVNNDSSTCGATVGYTMPTFTDNCSAGCNVPDSIPGYTLIGTYGGHTYFRSIADRNWPAQDSAAKALGAHLAVINTAGENNYLSTLGLSWMGLNDSAVEGKFVWVNGNPVTYTNWHPGAPSNGGGIEDYGMLNWGAPGKWNDGDPASRFPGIIEFDCAGVSMKRIAGLDSGEIFPIGTTTQTFVATDGGGNTDTCSFTVTVTDNEAPTIACNNNITVNNDESICGAIVNYTAPVGADNCSGATTALTAGLGSGATFPVGTTIETYTVTDAAGNTTSCSFTVTVVDSEVPNAIAQNTVIYLDASGTGSISVSDVNNGSTDNCGIDTMSISKTVYSCADVGTNTVTLTVTDVNGNTATATANVLVYDTVKPVIICPADVTVSCLTTTANTGVATATDACGIDSIGYTETSTYSSNPADAAHYNYTITRIWTATDVNGNVSNSCTQTITVQQLMLTGTTQDAACYGTATGSADLTAQGGVGTLSYTWSNGASTEDLNNVTAGTYTVTVTDSAGCTATKTFTINQPTQLVVSSVTMSPNSTVSGQANNTIYLGYGPQSVTLSASASGGTGSYSYSWTPTTGVSSPTSASTTVAPTVTTTYTLTVTDENGCTTTTTFTVEVIDILSGNNGNKVTICHKGKTLSVSVNAVQAHLNHGDLLGPCSSQSKKNTITDDEEHETPAIKELTVQNTIKVYPNPTTGTFTIDVPDNVKGGTVIIRDIAGKEIRKRTFSPNAQLRFTLDGVADGVYMVEVHNNKDVYREKLVIRR